MSNQKKDFLFTGGFWGLVIVAIAVYLIVRAIVLAF